MIYMDNAATTKTAPEVLDAMLPYFSEHFANPSSVYRFASDNKEAVSRQRDIIAETLGANSNEIYFTAGGSESDNWALKAAAEAYRKKGNHIITTKIEHHAVLHTAEYLERQGFEITYLDVDEDGKISLDELRAAIRPTTILISVMYANNEIGSVMPVSKIGAICRAHKVPFHTDAVQAAGHLPIHVREENIDLLSLSAHKFHGPKGAGVLYARRGIPLTNLIEGGAQERGRRGGTENVPAIMGMAAALEEACADMEGSREKLLRLRDRLIDGLSRIPHAVLNGDRVSRLPGNVNFCFEGIEGESLLLLLDDRGICASSGSACTSGSLDPSHVLLAIGRPHEVAHGSLRLSLSADNTEEEVEEILRAVPEVVDYLRNMSPLWKDKVNGRKEFVI